MFSSEPSISGAFGITGISLKQKNAERALREGKEDLARAQKVANIGSWNYEPASKRTRWSDQMYDIFSLPYTTQVTPDLFRSIVHPDDRDHVDMVFTDALRGPARFFSIWSTAL